MEADAVLLSRRVAAALHRLHVDQDRCVEREGTLEGVLQLGQVVPVQDADVGDPHVLEEADLGPGALERLLAEGERVEQRLADDRDARQRPLAGLLRLLVGA